MITRTKRSSKILTMLLALVLVISMMPMMAMAADVPISIATGEPVELTLKSGTEYDVTPINSDYYPTSFLMYAIGVDSVNATNGTTVDMVDNSDPANAYVVTLSPDSDSVVTFNIGGTAYILNCLEPYSHGAGGGTTPNAVNGYLPIGQYAKGTGWGSISKTGNNTGLANAKFVDGYTGTGVSLGAAGGYVEFAFNTPIQNNAKNPYGVDFVIYGNAFNGNPEAGSVKVYGLNSATKDYGWYELAGSLYYNDKTIRGCDITYTLNGSNIDYKIEKAGMNTISGTFKANGSAWWPAFDTANYGNVWGGVDDVVWSADHNYITYKNVTLVEDTDNTAGYGYGYFDVHANGANYGVAVNPYSIGTGSGGDGYDLAWAVDQDGNPVSISNVTKVRSYTSAAMNADGTGMTVPSIFGETSAEVCGIYVSVPASKAYTITGTPTVNYGLTADTATNAVSVKNGKVTELALDPGTYTLKVSADANVYVNSENTKKENAVSYEFTVKSGDTTELRVLCQDGEKYPFVSLIKVTSK